MIYLASDHGGYQLKEQLKAHLSSFTDQEVIDVGNSVLDPEDDFVDFAQAAAGKIGSHDWGIFICRNGVGVDIVANRYSHLRSVLGFDSEQVKKARADDDSNVLCLPADYIDENKANALVEAFLQTKFSGEPRFLRRLAKLEKIK